MKRFGSTTPIIAALLATAALSTPALAAITGFDVNFNGSDATYTDNFVRIGDSEVGGTGLNWGENVGTGGTGGLIVTEASGRNIFYRPAPVDNATSTFDMASLAVGQTFSSSIDFKWADTSSTGLTLITAGFTPANTSQTALTSSGALAGSIIRNNSSTVTLRMRNGNANDTTLDFNQSVFTAGEWYRISFDLTKTATENVFDYTVSLFSIGADGLSSATALTSGGNAISIANSASNSAIYTDSDAFFAYDIRGGGTGISHVDNLVVAIPEPSTFAALAGALALFAVGARRRSRA